MKKIIITAVVCAVTAGCLLALPEYIFENIPTAKSVKVQKIEYTDTLELTGNIVKNAADGEVSVVAYVGEKDISSVRSGQTAEITGDAFPDCVYTGTVSYIADYAAVKPNGAAAKPVIEVKIAIDNPDDRLKAGYTATARLATSDAETVTVVPYEAVDQDENGEFVYVLENNTAVRRYIVTGQELADGVEVRSGLLDGDFVITVESDYDGGRVLVED